MPARVIASVYPTEVNLTCLTCGWQAWFTDRQTAQAREAEEGHRCR